jgi:hypothetical protein
LEGEKMNEMFVWEKIEKYLDNKIRKTNNPQHLIFISKVLSDNSKFAKDKAGRKKC